MLRRKQTKNALSDMGIELFGSLITIAGVFLAVSFIRSSPTSTRSEKTEIDKERDLVARAVSDLEKESFGYGSS